MENEKKGIVLTKKALVIIIVAVVAVVAVVGVVVGSMISAQQKAALAAQQAALAAQQAAEQAQAEAQTAKAEAQEVKDTYVRPSVGADGRIGYASNVITSDPETLQQAVDRMVEKSKEPGVSLEYKEIAYSEDGKHFMCYLGNSANNQSDMFLAIYADPNLTDELFLSELLRPGSRFEEIEIARQLPPGEHICYLVHTQVADEQQGEGYIQVIQAQIATTLKLIVAEPK